MSTTLRLHPNWSDDFEIIPTNGLLNKIPS